MAAGLRISTSAAGALVFLDFLPLPFPFPFPFPWLLLLLRDLLDPLGPFTGSLRGEPVPLQQAGRGNPQSWTFTPAVTNARPHDSGRHGTHGGLVTVLWAEEVRGSLGLAAGVRWAEVGSIRSRRWASASFIMLPAVSFTGLLLVVVRSGPVGGS